MQAIRQVRAILPPELGQAMEQYPAAEELRLRLGRPPSILMDGRETPLSTDCVEPCLLRRVLEAATNASLHAVPSLRHGYVCYRSLRIGVCGEIAFDRDELLGFRSISSLAIRIPHDVDASARAFAAALAQRSGNILIAAPPGGGKTSLLRALIREMSEQGHRVGVIDERGEIWAADFHGDGFDLGRCSDVITGLDKLSAAMQLLCGMNPEMIAMDEITRPEDLKAVEQILGCGVRLLATLHAAGREEMAARPLYRALLDKNVFPLVVTIRCGERGREYSVEENVTE